MDGESPATVLLNVTVVGHSPDVRSLTIERGAVTRLDGDRLRGARHVDLSGLSVAPGFVDLQVNGGYGIDLASEPERLRQLASLLPAHGVTSFCPTLVSSPTSVVTRALAVDRSMPARHAKVIGWHLEGPMLAPGRRGAHASPSLVLPEHVDLSAWTPQNGLRLATVAPELPGALDAIRTLSQRGVTVSVGHTDADANQMRRSLEVGAAMATHVLNAMGPLLPRDPGPAGIALTDQRVTCGLIADGRHIDPVILDVVWRCAGPDRIALTSDAMAAAGLADGRFRLGGVDVDVDCGVARTADGALAGSTTMLDRALLVMRDATGADVADLIPTLTSTPARVVGSAAGCVAVGGAADLVVLDDAQVIATIVSGTVAHDPFGVLGEPVEATRTWRS